MKSARFAVLCSLTLILTACSAEPVNTPSRAGDAAIAASDNANGQRAYELACAGCHDTGVDGAPRTGDADTWRNRSSLWEAVLFEHAKAGYLDMPARGGMTQLPDATVEQAADYMLSITHPNRPPDSE